MNVQRSADGAVQLPQVSEVNRDIFQLSLEVCAMPTHSLATLQLKSFKLNLVQS